MGDQVSRSKKLRNIVAVAELVSSFIAENGSEGGHVLREMRRKSSRRNQRAQW